MPEELKLEEAVLCPVLNKEPANSLIQGTHGQEQMREAERYLDLLKSLGYYPKGYELQSPFSKEQ